MLRSRSRLPRSASALAGRPAGPQSRPCPPRRKELAMSVTNAAIADAVSRTVAIAGLAAIALIHVLLLPDAFSETFYLGMLFSGAVVAAVLVAATLTRGSDRSAWTATAALPALILLGYLFSRTTGLPDATDDV